MKLGYSHLFALLLFLAGVPLVANEFEIITVKQGDTLSKISQTYLEDPQRWRELLQYNQIANPNLIRPGIKLKIPAYLGKKIMGIVVFRNGNSMISRDNTIKWQPIAVKDHIYRNNRLKTERKSNIHIQIDQHSLLKIYPESEIIFEMPSPRAANEFSYFLNRGRLSSRIVRNEGYHYTVKTPAAVAAVRGTEFETEVNEKRTTTLRCFEGAVEVTAQKKTVTVPAGYGIMVEYGKPPGDLFVLPAKPIIIQER